MMRILRVSLCLLSIAFVAGCGEAIGERKQPIALEKVPADILKVAQEKYPDLVFETAFTEIEDGQPVYELKGKAKSGKMIEVEVTKDGKILK
jgi:hypothetical protein